jgi:ATP-binding protein involved in chromosome partitioning
MSVGCVIAVGSGKGGVGKSSVAVGLAKALRDRGQKTGILDADTYGPDIPLMLGVTRTTPARHITVWRARDVPGMPGGGGPDIKPLDADGLKVMSLQFLMAEGQAFAAAGPLATLMIGRLSTDIDWGDLDFLVIDLPPGTGDVSQGIVQSLTVAAAIVVVTPQDVAHLDTRKMLDFFRLRRVRVLGGVENMTTVECPHCQHDFPLFRSAEGRPTIWDEGVARLASLPFDPAGFGVSDGANGSAGATGAAGAAGTGLGELADLLLLEFPGRP